MTQGKNPANQAPDVRLFMLQMPSVAWAAIALRTFVDAGWLAHPKAVVLRCATGKDVPHITGYMDRNNHALYFEIMTYVLSLRRVAMGTTCVPDELINGPNMAYAGDLEG